MSIGSRIRFIRMKRGLTQRELGIKLGFTPSNADVRVAQYESDGRIPREELMKRIADALNVSVSYLNPDPNTISGMLKMLCAMEDDNRLRIRKYQGKPMIAFQNTDKSDEGLLVQALMQKWAEKAEMLQRGEITQEEYDQWRWNDIE